jgi:O-antigen ligase
MSVATAAGAAAGRSGLRRGAGVALLAAALAAATLAAVGAVVLGGLSPAVVAVPGVLGAAVYALWRLPLRTSATGLVVLLLSLDRRTDALGVWYTPLAIVGDLLNINFDAVVPAASGFKLSGMEVILLMLLAVAIHRRITGSTIDARGQVETAGVMRDAVLVYLVAVAFGVANGYAHGGSTEIVIWQVRPLLDTAALFFLFQAAFRGPQDHALLGKIIVLSASIKALLALWVRYGVTPRVRFEMPHMTNHGESILFVVACMVLLTQLMERTSLRRRKMALLLLPLILWGMAANNRRVAWVQLAFAVTGAWFISPWRGWKRAVTRFLLVASPVTVLYLAVGWEVDNAFFRPVRIVRSVVDTKADRSAWDRHVENWNLAMSMRERPIIGRGFGHEWTELYVGDNILPIFPQYMAEPHNQVLGLLLFAGLFAFSGIWLLFAVQVFLAVRAHRAATAPEDRAAALVCMGTVLVVVVQCYGDLGPFWTQYKVLTALTAAAVAKLAVATGAWPSRARRAAPDPGAAGDA